MNPSILLVIGTIAILTMVVFVIFFVLLHQRRMFENRAVIKEKESVHQKKLIDATIQVAELEREKIAKDIHDDVGSVLNVINLYLNRITRNPQDVELTKQLVGESKELLESSIENIRSIARDLMPPILIRLGYENGLSELCRQIKTSNSIDVQFIPNKETIPLSKKVELQLYRIVQESINNIIKHASASEISISLQQNTLMYTTQIRHNGKGISSEIINQLSEGVGGIGLRSIQSRAQMINASVQYITINSHDARITIDIPIDDATN
jgi:two-component system, NarL family, sensor kinase